MKLSRREAFVALGGATLLTGCSRLSGQAHNLERRPALPPEPKDDLAVAVLDRFGFGANANDLEKIRKVGVETWFESQLDPTDDEPAQLGFMLQRLDINNFGPYDLRDWKEDAIVAQLEQAALLRAVYSPWQVRERLCDFWTNHFNIFAHKGLAAYRKPMDEKNVVRAHALGNFPDMVRASAHSSAMLVFLDQQNSNYLKPNENYARELMELHTLGVNGGYTQQDVMEVARCFTGWTEERRFLQKKGSFRFRPELHDNNAKTVLGHTIPAGGGEADGDMVVNIVTSHPSAAKFIAGKLCTYFLGDNGDKVAPKIAKTYQETRGDIKAMMRDIFKAFVADPRPVVKRPLDFVASSLRALDASTDAGPQVQKYIADMGQPLYQWPMPDGFPVDTSSWTGSMLARWNFATALTNGSIPGTTIDLKLLDKNLDGQRALKSVYHADDSHKTVEQLASLTQGLTLVEQTALALCAPEFQWK